MPLSPIHKLPYPDPNDPADGPDGFSDLVLRLEQVLTPVGALNMWPTATPPTGWLVCDGSQVSAATYPALASVLGQVSGQITLPDYRDRFPVGAGAIPLASAGGANTFSMSVAQMPSHNHGGATASMNRNASHAHTEGGANSGPVVVGDPSHYMTNTFQQYGSAAGYGATDSFAPWDHSHGISATNTDHEHAISANGSGAAIDNRPQYRAVNFIIRAA